MTKHELNLMGKIIVAKFASTVEEKRNLFIELQKEGHIFLSEGCNVGDSLIDEFFSKCYESNGRIPDLNNFLNGNSLEGIPIAIGVTPGFVVEVMS